ncbi:MAG: ferredoxin, partial [Candidatus Saccharimonadales bacterium]
QSLCTGDRLCEDYCPELFEVRSDGVAYLRFVGQTAVNSEQLLNQREVECKLTVPPEFEDDIKQLFDDCPGECIFIE